MNYLRIINVLLLAAAVTMAVVLGVVALIYALYAGETPRLARELPGILTITSAFAVYALIAGAACMALFKRWRWLWLGQGALIVASGFLGMFIWEFLQ